MGLFGDVFSLFGSSAVEDAAAEAQQQLTRAREAADRRGARFQNVADPFLNASLEAFDFSQSLRPTIESLFDFVGNSAQSGLTAAEELSFRDSQRLLNENLASTGNLRSGAASLANARLASEVFAGADTRRLNQLVALSGVQGGLAQQAFIPGQIGLGLNQLATSLFNTSAGLAVPQAQSTLNAGQATANRFAAFGNLADTSFNTLTQLASAALSGGATSPFAAAGPVQGPVRPV